MAIFMPDHYFHTILEVTPDFLKNKGIKAIILDVDNTLAVYEKQEPAEGVPEWIKEMKEAGFAMMIVSNNSAERIAPFAERIGVDFMPKSKKPLGIGIIRACRKMNVSRCETVMIGDQILTDILGGNLHGNRTILLDPFELETSRFFRAKRRFEKPFRERYHKRKGNRE